MEIPFLQERMRLQALRAEAVEVRRLQEAAEAGPKAEYVVRNKLPETTDPQQLAAAHARLKPFHDAWMAARAPFEAALEEIHGEEQAITEMIGCGLYDDGESSDHVCAITGLPLLQNDDLRLVLVCALERVSQRAETAG